jgi:hypothetical protein
MSGTVVFNSFPNSQEDSVLLTGPENVAAQEFESDSNTNDTISDVQLFLTDVTPGDGGDVVVSLVSDSGGTPGGATVTLGTIQDSALTEAGGTVDLAISGVSALTADTQYWIELSGSASSEAEWEYTTSDLGTNVAAEFNYYDGTSELGATSGTFLMSVVESPPCFARGTRILTAQGEVAVEDLQPGDRVATPRRGGFAQVRWIGRRTVDLARHPHPRDINPVRVQAHAFGMNRPHRELILSPGHAVFVEDALVRIRDLLNGASIVQQTAERITYYHVELDGHDVLLAEGLPAESYLDIGNRAAFENGGVPMQAHPEFLPTEAAAQARAQEIWDSRRCAEMLGGGPRLVSLRRRLHAQAVMLGHATTSDPALHLFADGRWIRPTPTQGGLLFALPDGTSEVRLVSRSVVPAEIEPDDGDARRLGVLVTALALDGMPLALDSQRLGTGWHAVEPNMRWTDGEASIAVAGARSLTLGVAPLPSYWVSPPPAALHRAA